MTSVLLPDRTLLASGALDGTVHLHELVGFSEERTLRGHRSTVNQVRFSADGLRLGSAMAAARELPAEFAERAMVARRDRTAG